MKNTLDNEDKNELGIYLELLSHAVSEKLSHRFFEFIECTYCYFGNTLWFTIIGQTTVNI